MRNDLGKSDDGIERGAELMAHIGQKLALGAVCHLCLVARLDQFSLGCLQISYVRVNRDNRPVGHGAAADLQDASPGSHALLCCRYVVIEPLETFGDLGRGVLMTKVATGRLKHQDVAKWRTEREVRATNRPRLSKTLRPSPICSSVFWSSRASAQRLRRKGNSRSLMNAFTTMAGVGTTVARPLADSLP